MGVEAEVQGFVKEESLFLDVKCDEGEILIGRHGRTLESLQTLINRMANKQINGKVRIILDIEGYRKRRMESLTNMANRLGERAKRTGKGITVGPFSAHDRRTIHIALKQDPSLKTESLGEGEWKRITIIPTR